MWKRLALVATTLGCGGPKPIAGGDDHASCAATYASVPIGATCAPVGQSCAYPEGECFCGPGSYCGGVKPSPKREAELERPRWQCRATRTDGCPADPPSGACTTEGQTCRYGDCCVTESACTNGTWVFGEKSCPP